MPCNSDYMEASDLEVNLSRVLCLLGELKGQTFKKSSWDGYHPLAYNVATKAMLDEKTAELCAKLQTAKVSEYSLEMQMWWRDHRKADKARLKKELESARVRVAKQRALAKLTPYERGLLGL